MSPVLVTLLIGFALTIAAIIVATNTLDKTLDELKAVHRVADDILKQLRDVERAIGQIPE